MPWIFFVLVVLAFIAWLIKGAVFDWKEGRRKVVDAFLEKEKNKLQREYDEEKRFLYAEVQRALEKAEKKEQEFTNKCNALKMREDAIIAYWTEKSKEAQAIIDKGKETYQNLKKSATKRNNIEIIAPFPTDTTKNNKSLWNINPLFFDDNIADYERALSEPITKRALEEPFVFDALSLIKEWDPYDASAVIHSVKDYGEIHTYVTSLERCTCPYHENNHKVCKHMMALAMKVGAITVDVEEVLNRE